jgi:hypothetical protein
MGHPLWFISASNAPLAAHVDDLQRIRVVDCWLRCTRYDGDPLGDISVIADPNPTMKLIMKDARIHKNALQGKTVFICFPSSPPSQIAPANVGFAARSRPLSAPPDQ